MDIVEALLAIDEERRSRRYAANVFVVRCLSFLSHSDSVSATPNTDVEDIQAKGKPRSIVKDATPDVRDAVVERVEEDAQVDARRVAGSSALTTTTPRETSGAEDQESVPESE